MSYQKCLFVLPKKSKNLADFVGSNSMFFLILDISRYFRAQERWIKDKDYRQVNATVNDMVNKMLNCAAIF